MFIKLPYRVALRLSGTLIPLVIDVLHQLGVLLALDVDRDSCHVIPPGSKRITVDILRAEDPVFSFYFTGQMREPSSELGGDTHFRDVVIILA